MKVKIYNKKDVANELEKRISLGTSLEPGLPLTGRYIEKGHALDLRKSPFYDPEEELNPRKKALLGYWPERNIVYLEASSNSGCMGCPRVVEDRKLKKGVNDLEHYYSLEYKPKVYLFDAKNNLPNLDISGEDFKKGLRGNFTDGQANCDIRIGKIVGQLWDSLSPEEVIIFPKENSQNLRSSLNRMWRMEHEGER